MKRRKFIAASVLSSTFGVAAAQNMVKTVDLENEIYELKSYELTFGGAESALLKYLKEHVYNYTQSVNESLSTKTKKKISEKINFLQTKAKTIKNRFSSNVIEKENENEVALWFAKFMDKYANDIVIKEDLQ